MFLDSLAALHRYLPSNESDSLAEDPDMPMNPISCDQFRMFEFKVRRCAHGRSYDWTDCPYATRARRPGVATRESTTTPALHALTSARATARRVTRASSLTVFSSAGSTRPGTGTQPCKDGLHCNRRVCFFAHTPEQLRVLPGQSPRTQADRDWGDVDLFRSFLYKRRQPLSDPDLLPEGAEATVDLPFENTANLKIAYDLLQKPIKQFIADRLPDWIITDFAAHWVVEIGKDGNTDDILPSPESFTSPPDLVISQSIGRVPRARGGPYARGPLRSE
ncbi:hypothetical protein ACFXTN_012388 [Malus domestica]